MRHVGIISALAVLAACGAPQSDADPLPSRPGQSNIQTGSQRISQACRAWMIERAAFGCSIKTREHLGLRDEVARMLPFQAEIDSRAASACRNSPSGASTATTVEGAITGPIIQRFSGQMTFTNGITDACANEAERMVDASYPASRPTATEARAAAEPDLEAERETVSEADPAGVPGASASRVDCVTFASEAYTTRCVLDVATARTNAAASARASARMTELSGRPENRVCGGVTPYNAAPSLATEVGHRWAGGPNDTPEMEPEWKSNPNLTDDEAGYTYACGAAARYRIAEYCGLRSHQCAASERWGKPLIASR